MILVREFFTEPTSEVQVKRLLAAAVQKNCEKSEPCAS